MKKIRNMKKLVEYLTNNEKTISVMESCTGGAITNAITNIPGSSDVIKYSAITYSNEFKIKLGVKEEKIKKYTVYSMEVADEMSTVIANYTNSNYSIGVTGRLNRIDKNNIDNEDEPVNEVFISIYDKDNDKYYQDIITVKRNSRKANKKKVIKTILNTFNDIIKNI